MSVVEELYKVVANRKKNPIEDSYTSYLFETGLDKILKKVGEETTEVVIAAKNQDKEELVSEVGDLLYHLLVMLAEVDVPFSDIEKELAMRTGKLSTTRNRKEITEY